MAQRDLWMESFTHTAQGAKSNFCLLHAKSSSIFLIHLSIRTSTNGSIFLIFVKLYCQFDISSDFMCSVPCASTPCLTGVESRL